MKSSLAYLVPIAFGTSLGAALGYFGQCTRGICPLTATWWRGALYGAILGVLWAVGSRHS